MLFKGCCSTQRQSHAPADTKISAFENVKRMKEKMDLLIKHMKETSLPSVKTRVDEKIKEQIRALGYIQ